MKSPTNADLIVNQNSPKNQVRFVLMSQNPLLSNHLYSNVLLIFSEQTFCRTPCVFVVTVVIVIIVRFFFFGGEVIVILVCFWDRISLYSFWPRKLPCRLTRLPSNSSDPTLKRSCKPGLALMRDIYSFTHLLHIHIHIPSWPLSPYSTAKWVGKQSNMKKPALSTCLWSPGCLHVCL